MKGWSRATMSALTVFWQAGVCGLTAVGPAAAPPLIVASVAALPAFEATRGASIVPVFSTTGALTRSSFAAAPGPAEAFAAGVATAGAATAGVAAATSGEGAGVALVEAVLARSFAGVV